MPGRLQPAESKSQPNSSAFTPSTPKWRLAPSAATTTRRISPRGFASWQKASKAARPSVERNSGGMEPVSLVSTLVVIEGAATATGWVLGFAGWDIGLGGGSVIVAAERATAVTLVPFSVAPPIAAGVPDCIKSRGRSRSAIPTISRSTSDSSDSKVISALLGRDIDTLTMVTLSSILQGYLMYCMGIHINVRCTRRQTVHQV